MTISSTRTFELTVNQLCIQALQLANLSTPLQLPQPSQLDQARSYLGNILKELQTRGEFARSMNMLEIPMVAGTFKYAVADEVLELVGTAMYIDASQQDLEKASGETIVTRQSRNDWQRNSSKDAQGQPTLYYYNRSLQPNEVWVWPIPEEAGTIRFQQEVQLADVQDGSATIDLKPFWMQYCLHRLAEMLAEAAGFTNEKIGRLRRAAEEYLRSARGQANQGVDLQLRVGHRTANRWRRRG